MPYFPYTGPTSPRKRGVAFHTYRLIAFVLFSVLAVTAKSITQLFVMQLLSGTAGCAVTATGAAVIADIWEVKEKGCAISVYYVGVLMGPTLDPMIGGAVVG